MPGPKPGQRPSGRQKGTPNKRTEEVRALFKRLKYDPLESMVYMATNNKKKLKIKEDIPLELRARMHTECAKYVYQKLQPVGFDKDGNEQSVAESFAAAVRDSNGDD